MEEGSTQEKWQGLCGHTAEHCCNVLHSYGISCFIAAGKHTITGRPHVQAYFLAEGTQKVVWLDRAGSGAKVAEKTVCEVFSHYDPETFRHSWKQGFWGALRKEE